MKVLVIGWPGGDRTVNVAEGSRWVTVPVISEETRAMPGVAPWELTDNTKTLPIAINTPRGNVAMWSAAYPKPAPTCTLMHVAAEVFNSAPLDALRAEVHRNNGNPTWCQHEEGEVNPRRMTVTLSCCAFEWGNPEATQ